MTLKYLTLTGADSNDPARLELMRIISDEYSFVEWGILYSESQAGNGRYVSKETLKDIVEQNIDPNPNHNYALHVCGRAVKELIAETGDILNWINNFKRIQLNFNRHDFSDMSILELLWRYPKIEFITQYNANNKKLVYDLCDEHNHTVLFDESGGQGISAKEWISPIYGMVCGYAGGLGPENIITEYEKIKEITRPQDFWLDMEGKLRTDDVFDFDKAIDVLKQIKSVI